MKKREIIKKEQTFTEMIKHCPYVKNSYYVIYYRKNNEDTKYGISIPKKTGKVETVEKMKKSKKLDVAKNDSKETEKNETNSKETKKTEKPEKTDEEN